MKIRNGFVSNSSSSSFVLIGCKVTEEQMEKAFGVDKWGGIDESKFKGFTYHGEAGEDGEGVFGISIVDFGDCDDIQESNIKIEDVTKKAELVAKKLNVPLSKVSIISGTYAC